MSTWSNRGSPLAAGAGRRKVRAARLLAVALCFANPLLHKPLSDLCDALFVRLGRTWYERLALASIGALCAGGIALGRARMRGPVRARIITALAVLAAMMVVAQRWLLVSNIELIHFPQFALLAALLLAGGLTPQTAWAFATAAGVLDETYQHLVIYARVPNTYFDVNDMLLNAIGAAWAIISSAGDAGATPRTHGLSRRRRRLAVTGALLGLAILLWLDPPRLPLLRKATTGRVYRVLSAPEGIALAALTWFLVRWTTWRRTEALVPQRSERPAFCATVPIVDIGSSAGNEHGQYDAE